MTWNDETAATVDSLGEGEQLILWAFRMIAVGRSGCPGLRRAFADAFGLAGEEAFVSLFTFAKYVGHRARRPVRLYAPGCTGVTADERSLLALFAAAQAGLGGGRNDRLLAHFTWLVEGTPSEAVMIMVKVVAKAMADGGVHLPLADQPLVRIRDTEMRPQLRTLH